MRILFDHGTPEPLAPLLAGHIVKKAKDMGWDQLSNGDLLKAAEEASFELLITTDKNIRYQQNLTKRSISIVVIGNAQWPRLRHHAHLVVAAVDAAQPGGYVEVEIPLK